MRFQCNILQRWIGHLMVFATVEEGKHLSMIVFGWPGFSNACTRRDSLIGWPGSRLQQARQTHGGSTWDHKCWVCNILVHTTSRERSGGGCGGRHSPKDTSLPLKEAFTIKPSTFESLEKWVLGDRGWNKLEFRPGLRGRWQLTWSADALAFKSDYRDAQWTEHDGQTLGKTHEIKCHYVPERSVAH